MIGIIHAAVVFPGHTSSYRVSYNVFIQQIIIRPTLCTKNCARYWGYINQQKFLPLWSLYFNKERQIIHYKHDKLEKAYGKLGDDKCCGQKKK